MDFLSEIINGNYIFCITMYSLRVKTLTHVTQGHGFKSYWSHTMLYHDTRDSVERGTISAWFCKFRRVFFPSSNSHPTYSKRYSISLDPPDTHNACDALNVTFLSAAVLVHPDPTQPFYVETLTSDFAIGVILSQLDDDGPYIRSPSTPGSLQPRKSIIRSTTRSFHGESMRMETLL